MAVRLGIAPIGWSNDDLPELGGEIPLEQCLAEARLAGFSGVEKGGKFPMDPDVLRPILERYGLALASGWFSGQLWTGDVETEKRRAADQLRLFCELGAPVMVYGETAGSVQGLIDTPVADRPVMPADAIGPYGERLTAFAEWLKAEGCPMAFHHHMGTVVQAEEDVDRIMAATGEAVGLIFDTGHLHFAGGDVMATARRHAARINHVHVKDIRPEVLARLKKENWSFLKGVLAGVFTVPGDGCIDYMAFANVLKEIGYAGWVVVEAEQDPAKANPLDMARIGHAELVRTLGAAGISITQ